MRPEDEDRQDYDFFTDPDCRNEIEAEKKLVNPDFLAEENAQLKKTCYALERALHEAIKIIENAQKGIVGAKNGR